MIYGDNPQKINERQDRLGLTSYSYAPQISAIVQSGNLYVYCVNNPITYSDTNGEWIHIVIGALVGAGVSTFFSYFTGSRDAKSLLTSAVGGALSGGLAASGVGLLGQVVGNAVIAGASNIISQSPESINDLEPESLLVNIAAGIVGGLRGGSGANTNHYLSSLSNQFIKRFTNSFRRFSGKALVNELSKALIYFWKSSKKINVKMLTDIIRSNIPSALLGGSQNIESLISKVKEGIK